MGQVSNMVLAINKKGWKHGDIAPGNVRWNEKTGEPTAIDWGKAERTHGPPSWFGQKLWQKWSDKRLTAPVEHLRKDNFKISLYGALDKAEAQRNQPAASCSNA
jgi:hypothetical protein